MTNKEKIIAYLKENGIDVTRAYYIIEDKLWQKSGTLVIKDHYLNRDERMKLFELDDRRFDDTCPIEIHDIRYHFEWQYGYKRVSLKKKTA